ncbi:MAG TPA: hydrogenase maturation protease [Bacteroidales bacterium]|nr:hydrogenase maturation protease [Bacteroidales bacterium]
MDQNDNKILIMGLGNVLMGDEGIGVRAIEYLRQYKFPHNITLLDGGTGGFHLLSLFDEYQSFILIDATISSDSEGIVSVIKPRFASDFPRTLTSHDIGLRDLMQSAQLLGDLPDISLITVSVKDFRDVKIGVSDILEKCLPDVYDAVCKTLIEKGIDL